MQYRTYLLAWALLLLLVGSIDSLGAQILPPVGAVPEEMPVIVLREAGHHELVVPSSGVVLCQGDTIVEGRSEGLATTYGRAVSGE